MPFQLCFILQAAYNTYWLTAGLKRTTNVSEYFSDKTVSNHTGLPQISRQAWWWRGRRCVWMERLGGGKEQPIQAKGARSFEGKQSPLCLCFLLGWLLINNKSKDRICDMPLPAHPSCVQSDHGLAGCQRGAASRDVIVHPLGSPVVAPSLPRQGGDASGEPSDAVHCGSVRTVSCRKGSERSNPSQGKIRAVISGTPDFSWPVL